VKYGDTVIGDILGQRHYDVTTTSVAYSDICIAHYPTIYFWYCSDTYIYNTKSNILQHSLDLYLSPYKFPLQYLYFVEEKSETFFS
jgi:hypothetical protein